MIIKKQIEIKIPICDYCKEELDRTFPDQCAICGRHTCNKHTFQCEEDGTICINCNKQGYEIKYYSDNGCSDGVGVQKNGKDVEAPYL